MFLNGAVKTYRNINLLNTGSTVKSTPAVVVGWYLVNIGTATLYVKLYDKATAPVVGTDVPKMTLPLVAGVPMPAFFNLGLPFQFGLGIAATKNLADTDNTAPAASSIVANLYYL